LHTEIHPGTDRDKLLDRKKSYESYHAANTNDNSSDILFQIQFQIFLNYEPE